MSATSVMLVANVIAEARATALPAPKNLPPVALHARRFLFQWFDKLVCQAAGEMIHVGAFDAKTHSSSLLDRVSRGEEVLITRRGLPVARLVPAGKSEQARTEGAIRELRALRSGLTLDGLEWKALRDEGRR